MKRTTRKITTTVTTILAIITVQITAISKIAIWFTMKKIQASVILCFQK